jgi:hypothetical protein
MKLIKIFSTVIITLIIILFGILTVINLERSEIATIINFDNNLITLQSINKNKNLDISNNKVQINIKNK